MIGTAIVLILNIPIVTISDPSIYREPVDTSYRLEGYRQQCQLLCQKYIDTNFAPQEALDYCQKSFEIDLNINGKMGESGMLNAYGICEDKAYCFNMIECQWGPSEKNSLTPEKCKDIMCNVYTPRIGDNASAVTHIQQKMQFGSCDINDPEITVTDSNGTSHTFAKWWTDNFQNVHCPGQTG